MTKAQPARRWAIMVRLADGSELFYAEATDRGGQSEWSPRANQARCFDTEAAAGGVAAGFSTNSAAAPRP